MSQIDFRLIIDILMLIWHFGMTHGTMACRGTMAEPFNVTTALWHFVPCNIKELRLTALELLLHRLEVIRQRREASGARAACDATRTALVHHGGAREARAEEAERTEGDCEHARLAAVQVFDLGRRDGREKILRI